MPTCVLCDSASSSKWVRYGGQGSVCNACYIRERKAGTLPERRCFDCGDACPQRAERCEQCAYQHQLRTARERAAEMRGDPVWLESKERSRFKTNYGITWEQRDALLESQGGVCAICGRELDTSYGGRQRTDKAQLDHCAETGRVRGVLCRKCNIGIGNLQHDEQILSRAIEYLRKPST